MDLRTATSRLLRDPQIVEQLRLADMYIQAYNRMPDQFVLPRQHSVLQPVIAAFAADTKAFADYIRALRDADHDKSGAYDELHELYRTVSMRAMQSERRTRIRKAVLLLVPYLERVLRKSLSYEDQLRVGRFVEQRWGDMRLSAMADERSIRKAKRLNTEERAIALEQFWKSVDDALAKNEVPLGGQQYEQELRQLLA